jgi:hypothetical protein
MGESTKITRPHGSGETGPKVTASCPYRTLALAEIPGTSATPPKQRHSRIACTKRQRGAQYAALLRREQIKIGRALRDKKAVTTSSAAA